MKTDILDLLCLAQVEAALLNASDEVQKDINGFVSFEYVMWEVESRLRAEMESSLQARLDEVKKRRASLSLIRPWTQQAAPAGQKPHPAQSATPPWVKQDQPEKTKTRSRRGA